MGDDSFAEVVPIEQGGVGELLLDPVVLARREAEESGAAAAVAGGPELGDHELAAPPEEANVVSVEAHGLEVPRDGGDLAGGRVAEVVRDDA